MNSMAYINLNKKTPKTNTDRNNTDNRGCKILKKLVCRNKNAISIIRRRNKRIMQHIKILRVEIEYNEENVRIKDSYKIRTKEGYTYFLNIN